MKYTFACSLVGLLLLAGCAQDNTPAAGGKVINATSAVFATHLAGSTPILVDFYADW
ncbi:MAG: hypothetical protein OSB47_14405 [Pirellulaceae bacterium]|nr:hypothetical protein [Pirellulaceae bacterium]